jgi:hypothetical protein
VHHATLHAGVPLTQALGTVNQDYILPTRSSRIRVFLQWLGIFAVFGIAHIAARLFLKYIAPLPGCDQLPWIRLTLALVVLILLVPAWLFGRMAWKAYFYRQFPPPGTAVFFPTKISRGALAVFYAVGPLLMCCIFLWLLGYVISSGPFGVMFSSFACRT